MSEPLILAALKGLNTHTRPPVWLMRQAGRYMPSYQALRKSHSLGKMFRAPDLIAEVTRFPIDQLGVDAAILYSDILILLDLFGIQWEVKEGIGPVIAEPIRSEADFKRLRQQPPEQAVPFVAEGIRRFRANCNTPLIGFCGAPFTIASYLIEGGPSKQLRRTREWMYRSPETFNTLLEILAVAAIDLLNFQIAAGVQAVQIFDSWANWLSVETFPLYSLRYMQKIRNGIIDKKIPVIFFCQGSSMFAPLMAKVQPDVMSLDWHCDLAALRTTIPRNIALQGNLDPCLLFAKAETIEATVDRLISSMRGDPGFVINLGHGILPETPLDNVRRLVDRVKSAG